MNVKTVCSSGYHDNSYAKIRTTKSHMSATPVWFLICLVGSPQPTCKRCLTAGVQWTSGSSRRVPNRWSIPHHPRCKHHRVKHCLPNWATVYSQFGLIFIFMVYVILKNGDAKEIVGAKCTKFTAWRLVVCFVFLSSYFLHAHTSFALLKKYKF